MSSSSPLYGKHALLIAPRFFGYDNEISSELKRQGAVIDRLYDRPFDTPLMTAATRFAPAAIAKAATPIYRRQLNNFGHAGYDLILIINGQTLSTEMLQELRAAYPSATIVLYLWDSLDNRASVVKNLDFVDTCLSFDPEDVRKYGLRLRPLFFSQEFENTPDEIADIDISFIGTAHTDRAAVVKRVDAQLDLSISRYWYLFLQAPWVYYSRKLVDMRLQNCTKADFVFQPLEKTELRRVFFRSKTILDVEHPKQRGLTMRTLETVGAGRKIITTNANIVDYNLYDPSNVRVIDRQDPARIDGDFLNEPFKPLPLEIYRHYSISGWMTDVLGLREPT